MKRILLFLIIMIGILTGCQSQDEVQPKDQIQFTPNEDYVGDPNPEVKQQMKLSDEERAQFEKAKQDILSHTEGE